MDSEQPSTLSGRLADIILLAAGLPGVGEFGKRTNDAVVVDHPGWEAIAQALMYSGQHRVVRRFHRRSRYADNDGTATKTALFVDVETTGLDTSHDRIIEFAAVPFEYCPSTGRIFRVDDALVYLEDPGKPIPGDVVALTGITDDMVAGRCLDDAVIESAIAGASLIVAHNAAFDRKILERRLPLFANAYWACSMADVPWSEHGCSSTKLEFILFKMCLEFFHGHRAEDDCAAGVHILATPLPAGELPMRLLLASAREPTMRVWAIGTPIEIKDSLKARRYRWNSGDDGRPKAWYLDCRSGTLDTELAWLAEHAYGGRQDGWRIEKVTARNRYSERGQ